MKKGCLIAAACFVGLGIIVVSTIIFLAVSLTSGAADLAKTFLELTSEERYDEAYLGTSEQFRKVTSREEFEKELNQLRIFPLHSVSWSSRQVRNLAGTLEGKAKTASGEPIDITVKVIKEGDAWKVLNFETSGTKRTVPSREESVELARQALLDLNQAIGAEDFSTLHRKVATIWSEQATPEQLLQAFQPLIDARVDFSGVTGVEPVFDRDPLIDADGALQLAGHFPTRPRRTVFGLSFTDEAGEWKLIRINASSTVNPQPLPAPEIIRELVSNALQDFDEAVKAKDFSDFHAKLSTPFQIAMSPEDLGSAFGAFLENEADLSAVRQQPPIFNSPPSLNSEGVLIANGHYPAPPSRVEFKLQFIPEESEWRLLRINVGVE